MNKDIIYRQAAIDALDGNVKVTGIETAQAVMEYIRECAERIRSLPSAQPEQKRGKWEEIEVIPEAYDVAGVKTWASKMRCNQCGFTTFAIEGRFAQYYFCPNCGSYNGGEQDETL